MKTIKFTDKMLQLIKDGKKTQTRRVIKLDSSRYSFNGFDENLLKGFEVYFYDNVEKKYAKNIIAKYDIDETIQIQNSEIKLQITDINVESIQDISPINICREGLDEKILRELDYYDNMTQSLTKDLLNEPSNSTRKNELKKELDFHKNLQTYTINNMEKWFISLWDEIYKDYSWDKNPYVFAYTFKII